MALFLNIVKFQPRAYTGTYFPALTMPSSMPFNLFWSQNYQYEQDRKRHIRQDAAFIGTALNHLHL